MTEIKSISKLVTPIAEKYGTKQLALFGSREKNTAKETSDYETFGSNVDVITDTSNDIWTMILYGTHQCQIFRSFMRK